MYILFEGIDTCGKSTQVELLKENVPDALFTHEPGGTVLGADIRTILLHDIIVSKTAEAFLFLADRAEHYESVVKPNRDKLIVSDRGFVSGMAYAMANGKDDFSELLTLNKIALQGNLPEKIVLFVLPKEELITRLSSKGNDMIEQRGIEYLIQVQHNMQTIIKRLGIDHIEIDATKSIVQINAQILNFILEK